MLQLRKFLIAGGAERLGGGEELQWGSFAAIMRGSALRDDTGQDLTEYALLLAFVCLASTALFMGAQGSMNSIWGTTNSLVNGAASLVS